MFGSINRILLAVSHSGNLLIYCASNQSFRKVLYRQLSSLKCAQEINSSRPSPQSTRHEMTKINNQVRKDDREEGHKFEETNACIKRNELLQ